MWHARIESGLFGALLFAGMLGCSKGDGAVSANKIGVPECDDYLEKYEKCVKEKVPEVARPSIEQAIKMSRDSYKKLAEDAATKASLPKACKQALDLTKMSMQPYGGCNW